MKRRIIAFLTAIMMLVSMFLLTGCFGDKDDKDDDKSTASGGSEITDEVKTAKDILLNALQNTFNKDDKEEIKLPDVLTNHTGDMKFDMSLNVNKLSAQGEDITGGKPINLSMTAQADRESKLYSGQMSLDFMGENPVIDMVYDETDGNYYFNIKDITEKPIQLNPEMMGEEAVESFDYASVYEAISEAISTAILENMDESAFTSETKDVTIDGTEYKGATVITVAFGEKAFAEIEESITKILEENEAVKDLIESGRLSLDFDLDELKEIKVVATIAAEALVGMDIEITAVADDTEDDDEDQSGVIGMADTFVGTTETFAIRCSINGDNYKIKMGILGEDDYDYDQGVVAIEYTYDSETFAEVFSVDLTEGKETTNVFKAEGTYKDNKHEGALTVEIEGQPVNIEYSIELGEDKGKIEIPEINMEMNGMTITIPLNLSIEYLNEETKSSFSGSIDTSFMGMIEVDIEFSFDIELVDVTVEKVTDSVAADQLDTEALGTAFMQKYPTIFAFIESMGGSEEYPDNDENWGDDWTDEEWEDPFEDYYSLRGDDSKLQGAWVCEYEEGTMTFTFDDGTFTYHDVYYDAYEDEEYVYEYTDKYYAKDGVLCLYLEGVIDYVCEYDIDGNELTLEYLYYEFTEVYEKQVEGSL